MHQERDSRPNPLPGLLTADLPGTGGVVRSDPEDFRVEEIPLYAPSGEGAHTLLAIEKRGIDTLGAIRGLARALRIDPQRIGMAGLKDAQAVARQHLSVEGVAPEAVLAARVPGVRVLWAERHRNRLKIGHLRGNRFTIRLRDVAPGALERAREIVAVLCARGLPNAFGPQRFGRRGTNHLLGRAALLGDWQRFADLLLGGPRPADTENVRRARAAYDAGDLRASLGLWPAYLREERTVAGALAAGAAPQEAWRRLPKGVRRLFVAAYQAYLFNRLLDERLPHLDRLEAGDLAILHANDAFFLVEDPAAEQPRADRLEISPSGPLYGYKVRLARGAVGDREHALLGREGLRLDAFRLGDGVRLEGERRAFRVPLGECAVEEDAGGLVLRFTLPPGAYATSLLREVTKTEVS